MEEVGWSWAAADSKRKPPPRGWRYEERECALVCPALSMLESTGVVLK